MLLLTPRHGWIAPPSHHRRVKKPTNADTNRTTESPRPCGEHELQSCSRWVRTACRFAISARVAPASRSAVCSPQALGEVGGHLDLRPSAVRGYAVVLVVHHDVIDPDLARTTVRRDPIPVLPGHDCESSHVYGRNINARVGAVCDLLVEHVPERRVASVRESRGEGGRAELRAAVPLMASEGAVHSCRDGLTGLVEVSGLANLATGLERYPCASAGVTASVAVVTTETRATDQVTGILRRGV